MYQTYSTYLLSEKNVFLLKSDNIGSNKQNTNRKQKETKVIRSVIKPLRIYFSYLVKTYEMILFMRLDRLYNRSRTN